MDTFGEVGPEHDNNHLAPEGETDLTWQESWAFAWYDPLNRIGGWQHCGMQRLRGVTDINSYVAHDGRMIDDYEHDAFPLPAQDYTNITFGPVTLKSLEPLTKHQVILANVNSHADLTLNTTVGPFWMGHGNAPHHWEGFGRVTGQVKLADKTVPVNGFFFHDRSWGTRDWDGMFVIRLVCAIFGDDMIFRLFQMTGPQGRKEYGYALINGQFKSVLALDNEILMTGDGMTPAGVQITAYTEGGEAWRITGRARDTHLMTHGPKWMMSHSNLVYECGGRVGTGFLEVSERRVPPIELQDRKALPK